jgi:hypothetical protein
MTNLTILSVVATAYSVIVLPLAVTMAIIGFTGLILPHLLRDGLKQLVSSKAMLPLGFILIAAGLVIAVRGWPSYSAGLQFPHLALLLGVLTAAKGFFWLLFPGLVRRIVEWHALRRNNWFRAIGVISLAFSALFFVLGIPVR